MRPALIVSFVVAMSATASAQVPGLGELIAVNLSDIRAEIAKNVNLDFEKVPITINLPINIAANVCGTSVNALSVQVQQGNNNCTATNVSVASQAVQNTVQ